MTNDMLARARALIAATEGHTPGPWRSDADGAVRSARGMICRAYKRAPAIPAGAVAGNARLVAAAPDAIALVAELAAEVERLRAAQEPRDYGTANNLAEVAEHYRLKGLVRKDQTP